MPTSRRIFRSDLLAIRVFMLLMMLCVGGASIGNDEVTRIIPLLHSSSDPYDGFLRIINHSKETQDVSIKGFDDEGTEYGPATFVLGSQENKLIYAEDLEDGSGDVEDGLGKGVGSWRLEIRTSRDVEATAYSEAQGGLLESLQATIQGENGCWRIPTFYSPDNFPISKLRLSNPGSETANVRISGRDDGGSITATDIQIAIGAGESESFTAAQLEKGTDDFIGSLGNGEGNWQLAVESDRLITVMSLIEGSDSGYISNVSTRPSYALGHCWLGKTLAHADRSIGNRIYDATIPGEDELIAPAPLTPAIYAAIADETGVRAIAAEGLKKWGSDIKASIHDRLHLDSIAQPMTAVMIATHVYDDESVFARGWDTTIGDVFSDHTDTIHENYHEVNLKEILTHRSGIRGNLPENWVEDPDATIIEQRHAAMLATLERGTIINRGVFSHSNAAYVVAAAMVEKLTGRSWETEMQERVFGPLSMESAGFGAPASIDGENAEPWGHTLSVENVWEPTLEDRHEVLNPSTGVHASMEDLAKFLSLWMDHKEPMLLSRQRMRELTFLAANADGEIVCLLPISPCILDAYPSAGWRLSFKVFGYRETLNTSGSNGNWSLLVWIMRDISRAYFVVANSALPKGRFDNDPTTIRAVLEPLIDRLATSPARSEPPQLSSDAPK